MGYRLNAFIGQTENIETIASSNSQKTCQWRDESDG
jgi:hypothetical protein